MSKDFDFNDLEPDELDLLTAVYHRYRHAKFKRHRWVSLIPNLGDDRCEFPIYLPDTSKHSSAPETLSSPVNAVSSPAPSPASDNGIADNPGDIQDLTATDEAIISVLSQADSPIKIATIAQRAKLNFGSHCRERVYHLVQIGIIKKCEGNRYCLASRCPQDK